MIVNLLHPRFTNENRTLLELKALGLLPHEGMVDACLAGSFHFLQIHVPINASFQLDIRNKLSKTQVHNSFM